MDEQLERTRWSGLQGRVRELERQLESRRRMTRLIVRERDPARLLQGCCRVLCEALGLPGAWGVGQDEAGAITHRSWAGPGMSEAHIRTHRSPDALLPCVEQALSQPGFQQPRDEDSPCGDCHLAPDSSSQNVLRVRLEHDGVVRGALVMQLPLNTEATPELLAFVEDLSSDLALALHSIALERHRGDDEERLRTVTDTAQDAVISMAPDGSVSLWNPAAEAIFGYTAAEALGQPVHALLAPPDLLGRHGDAFPRFRRHGEGAVVGRTIELRARHKRGHEVPVELSLSAYERGDGWHAVAIARDISERQRLQAQLLQVDRLASVGLLAAGVAHEINNPLTYLLYNLEALQEELGGLPPEALAPSALEDLRTLVRDAGEGAERIRSIATDLKTFSRAEGDERERLLLRQPMEVAARMAKHELRHRARLETTFEEIPWVLGCEGQLAQVFLNLLVNAAQAIPEGHAHGNLIAMHARREGDEVRASVSDSGPGIAPDQLDRVFEPFYSTKPKDRGSGLGLSICRRIVQEHGGRLEVTSELGRGSTFTVCLPAL